MDAQPGDGAYRSSLSGWFTGDAAAAAAHLAALRQQLGDEAVDQMLRTRELMRHPRPLTGAERSVVDAALAPVLHDLRAGNAVVPEVRYEAREDPGPGYVCAFIGPAGQTSGSMGVRVALAATAAERVAQLADQVQEWEVEELCAVGRPATWPECPEHPGSHPLEPVVTDAGAASWRCPRPGLTVCAIGELAGPRRLSRAVLKLGRGPRATVRGGPGLPREMARHRLRRGPDPSSPRRTDDDRPPHLGLR
jgi:hypothetical protein